MKSKITFSQATPEGSITTELVTDDINELSAILSLAGLGNVVSRETDEPEELEITDLEPEEVLPEDMELDLYGIPAARPDIRYTGNYGDNALDESEEIDEISKHSLASYIKKSAEDARNAGRDEIISGIYKDYPDVEKNFNRSGKRLRGIRMATDKLANDQVDEVSKETLASYAKKAASDGMYRSRWVDDTSDPDEKRKERKKIINRRNGVEKAIDRLVQTEENIEEVSKETLTSYIDKASADADKKYREADLTRNDYMPSNELRREANKRANSVSKAKHQLYMKNASESTETLDEISKKTLGNYLHAAHYDKSNAAHDIGFENGKGQFGDKDFDSQEKANNKHRRRSAGIERAIDRLTKEGASESLDETSKEKLQSYMMKAAMDDKEKHRPGIKTAGKKISGKAKVNATEEILPENLCIDESSDELPADLIDILNTISIHAFGFDLKSRNYDEKDFHNVSVWEVKKALEAAFIAGVESTKNVSEGTELDERENAWDKVRKIPYKDDSYYMSIWKDGHGFLPTEEMQTIDQLVDNQYFGKELKSGKSTIYGIEMQNRDGTTRKSWYSSYGNHSFPMNKPVLFYHDQNPSNFRPGEFLFTLTSEDFASPEALDKAKNRLKNYGWDPKKKYSVRVAK